MCFSLGPISGREYVCMSVISSKMIDNTALIEASLTGITIHILKAHDDSYSKIIKKNKCEDKDNYKDNDKDKDAKRITGSLTVCHIFGILMTQAFQV